MPCPESESHTSLIGRITRVRADPLKSKSRGGTGEQADSETRPEHMRIGPLALLGKGLAVSGRVQQSVGPVGACSAAAGPAQHQSVPRVVRFYAGSGEPAASSRKLLWLALVEPRNPASKVVAMLKGFTGTLFSDRTP